MLIDRELRSIRWIAIFSLFGGSWLHAQTLARPQAPNVVADAQQRIRLQILQRRDASRGAGIMRSIFEVTPYLASFTPARVVGKRQTSQSLVPANSPLDRIESRIATRVNSRIDSRLDRFSAYPTTLVPFAAVANQASAGQARLP